MSPELGSLWLRRLTGTQARVVWIRDGILLTDFDATPWPIEVFTQHWDRL